MKKVATIVSACILAGSAISCTSVAEGEYLIDINHRYQQNEGWGVSLCWWANMTGRYDEAHLDSLITWLVSPDGLNYNVFRYNIGGGDDPLWRNCEEHHMGKGKGLRAEMEGFQDERGGEYHWDRDQAQIRVMRMIKAKRPDAIFEAFSNSAPYWMTYSGCVGGNADASKDNLRPEYYEDFAHYLVDVCKHFKDEYGIEFATLEPFNESLSSYWPQNGSQEGCHFDTASQIEFIKVLYPILKESGLCTIISASDETHVAHSVKNLRAYANAGVLDMVGQWNTHTYGGSADDKLELRQLCDSLGIKLWQSETGNGGKGIQGNLRMGQRLIEDIRCLQPAVWADWQYVEGNDQWSLVSNDPSWGEYFRHRNYYVRMHFSRFIKQGYTFVECTDPDALAAISPDGHELVYVSLNVGEDARELSTTLPAKAKIIASYYTNDDQTLSSGLAINCTKGLLTTTLPPLSIATMVFRMK